MGSKMREGAIFVTVVAVLGAVMVVASHRSYPKFEPYDEDAYILAAKYLAAQLTDNNPKQDFTTSVFDQQLKNGIAKLMPGLDNHLDSQAWKILTSKATYVRKGTKKTYAVEALKVLLREKFAYKVEEGPFMESLDKVVRDFQRKASTGADGIVGGGTWRLLLTLQKEELFVDEENPSIKKEVRQSSHEVQREKLKTLLPLSVEAQLQKDFQDAGSGTCVEIHGKDTKHCGRLHHDVFLKPGVTSIREMEGAPMQDAWRKLESTVPNGFKKTDQCKQAQEAYKCLLVMPRCNPGKKKTSQYMCRYVCEKFWAACAPSDPITHIVKHCVDLETDDSACVSAPMYTIKQGSIPDLGFEGEIDIPRLGPLRYGISNFIVESAKAKATFKVIRHRFQIKLEGAHLVGYLDEWTSHAYFQDDGRIRVEANLSLEATAEALPDSGPDSKGFKVLGISTDPYINVKLVNSRLTELKNIGVAQFFDEIKLVVKSKMETIMAEWIEGKLHREFADFLLGNEMRLLFTGDLNFSNPNAEEKNAPVFKPDGALPFAAKLHD